MAEPISEPVSIPVPSGSHAVMLHGERALLLAERALWLPAHDTVLVADLHWGKAATFRAAQVPIPDGTTAEDLHRLTHVLESTHAARLVVLGDLAHARDGWHPGTLAQLVAWRIRHQPVAIDLVRGNHDQHAGDPPAALDIRCVDGPLALGPLWLCHEPPAESPAALQGRHAIGGHFHPSVVLSGVGRQRLRLPAFIVGTHRTLLPAFTRFTGGGMYQPIPEDRPYVIADGEVIAVEGAAERRQRNGGETAERRGQGGGGTAEGRQRAHDSGNHGSGDSDSQPAETG